ncbi:hypothetical protein EV182_001191 [Spiromyces aspiralis]|uniref:Uncharacterized protein n=1 Tax=Spiromyces aspiralis TaxID=68401 RepID=A0ACC1HJR7_9FUNG|nr:hypothetical protein EV182_001191 [Spiromyces aspiralis]
MTSTAERLRALEGLRFASRDWFQAATIAYFSTFKYRHNLRNTERQYAALYLGADYGRYVTHLLVENIMVFDVDTLRYPFIETLSLCHRAPTRQIIDLARNCPRLWRLKIPELSCCPDRRARDAAASGHQLGELAAAPTPYYKLFVALANKITHLEIDLVNLRSIHESRVLDLLSNLLHLKIRDLCGGASQGAAASRHKRKYRLKSLEISYIYRGSGVPDFDLLCGFEAALFPRLEALKLPSHSGIDLTCTSTFFTQGLPNLRALSVHASDADFVRMVVRSCPNLECLELLIYYYRNPGADGDNDSPTRHVGDVAGIAIGGLHRLVSLSVFNDKLNALTGKYKAYFVAPELFPDRPRFRHFITDAPLPSWSVDEARSRITCFEFGAATCQLQRQQAVASVLS